MRRGLLQFAKYMVGGGLYFWTGYVVFSLTYGAWHWRWWQGKLAGDIIGWTLNYVVQRYWAFAGSGPRLSEMRHTVRYIVLNVGNLAIDYAIVGGLNAVGVTPFIGFFVSSAFFTVWNYIWYRFWVFAEDNN
jgi:putative flippase GtrA